MKTSRMRSQMDPMQPADPELFVRQERLKDIGKEGQRKIRASHVLIVGMGALGNPVVSYLAAAGLGKITICDFDRVELSNLHRQSLFGVQDCGKPKTEAAMEVLGSRYPHIEFVALNQRFDHDFPPEILEDVDLVMDCCDNFTARFAIHDLCLAHNKSFVSAAVQAFSGQLWRFPFADPDYQGPCLRCLYPEQPPEGCVASCAEEGILGAAAGIMGCAASLVALESIVGIPGIAPGTSYVFDLRSLETSSLSIPKAPECPHCAGRMSGSSRVINSRARAILESRLPTSPARPLSPMMNQDPELPKKGRILDIREEAEVEALDRVLVSNAELIPMKQLLDKLSGLDRQESYILVCEKGARSAYAARIMKEQGFEKVYSLEGGFAALRASLR